MTKRLPRLNASEFAELLCVSIDTVSTWAQQGMPHAGGGRQGKQLAVDLRRALPWVVARRDRKSTSQRERVAHEQADKLSLANAERRGQVILADQVRKVLLSMGTDLAARLDSLPGRVASELAMITEPAAIRARLLIETRAIRAGFAEHVRELAGRPHR